MSSCQVGRTLGAGVGEGLGERSLVLPLWAGGKPHSWGAPQPLTVSAARVRVLTAVCSQWLLWLLLAFVLFLKPPHTFTRATQHSLALEPFCLLWRLDVRNQHRAPHRDAFFTLFPSVTYLRRESHKNILFKENNACSVSESGSCRSSRYICIRKMNHNNENTIPYQENGLAKWYRLGSVNSTTWPEIVLTLHFGRPEWARAESGNALGSQVWFQQVNPKLMLPSEADVGQARAVDPNRPSEPGGCGEWGKNRGVVLTEQAVWDQRRWE